MSLLDKVRQLFVGHQPVIIISVCSSTEEYPAPKDVYLAMLKRVEIEIDNGRDIGYAVFRPKGKDKLLIQITRCLRDIGGAMMNFTYPHLEEPGQKLTDLEIELPDGCCLVKWEPMKNAIYEYETYPTHEEMADTVGILFERVLGLSKNDMVKGEVMVQNMPVESDR